MPTLVRMSDLKQYGVNNWVTLGRWIKEEGAPAGFYLGKNTRAWYKEDWDTWLANRPKADPPPEIVVKPAPSVDAEGSRPGDASASRQSNPTNKPIESIPQAFPNGRAGR